MGTVRFKEDVSTIKSAALGRAALRNDLTRIFSRFEGIALRKSRI